MKYPFENTEVQPIRGGMTGDIYQSVLSPSTLQPFNPSTFQPFNP